MAESRESQSSETVEPEGSCEELLNIGGKKDSLSGDQWEHWSQGQSPQVSQNLVSLSEKEVSSWPKCSFRLLCKLLWEYPKWSLKTHANFLANSIVSWLLRFCFVFCFCFFSITWLYFKPITQDKMAWKKFPTYSGFLGGHNRWSQTG